MDDISLSITFKEEDDDSSEAFFIEFFAAKTPFFQGGDKSPVSHADPIAWTVTESEYEDYRYHVGECLKQLL